ncbi:MAG: AraC family transcriptional regulator, partial [Actinomycetota bacterium]
PAVPDCLWFHVVTSGTCVLIDGEGRRHSMGPGDIAILPRGSGHRATDGSDTDTPVVFDLPHHYVSRRYAILRHGAAAGPLTTVVCGLVQLGHPAARPLLAALPEVIHVERTTVGAGWDWLPPMLGLMAEETRRAKPGGETVVTRLCDVVVIQGLRHWIDTDPAARTGWLGALRDPEVGRAMALIHTEPAQPWTVEGLARAAGLSRSAFAVRFAELVGRTPKQYLTSWRMRLAEDLLATTSDGVLSIATELGYGSEAAFSRAFKRETGRPPSAVRRSGGGRSIDVGNLATGTRGGGAGQPKGDKQCE